MIRHVVFVLLLFRTKSKIIFLTKFFKETFKLKAVKVCECLRPTNVERVFHPELWLHGQVHERHFPVGRIEKTAVLAWCRPRTVRKGVRFEPRGEGASRIRQRRES